MYFEDLDFPLFNIEPFSQAYLICATQKRRVDGNLLLPCDQFKSVAVVHLRCIIGRLCFTSQLRQTKNYQNSNWRQEAHNYTCTLDTIDFQCCSTLSFWYWCFWSEAEIWILFLDKVWEFVWYLICCITKKKLTSKKSYNPHVQNWK